MSTSMSSKQLLFFRVILFCIVVYILASCARAVTPGEAASGRYKKCRAVR
jgi:hypothetical protein